jgi:hypothetical protein
MEEDHLWCASAAPWLLFPWEDLPNPATPLRESVEAGSCSVVDEHGEVASTDIHWFGDGETCEGMRVFGLGGAGLYRVECGGGRDSGADAPSASPFGFEVGADTCPVGDLDGATVFVEDSIRGRIDGILSLPHIDDQFFDAGGLLWAGGEPSRLLGYSPVYFLPLYCENVGPTLSLQILQPDGSESEVVELEMPCDAIETGCASAAGRASPWMALLGLPLVILRRARQKRARIAPLSPR